MEDPQDRLTVSEVIRPAAVVPEDSARSILVELALLDVYAGGVWLAKPNLWSRWSQPWTDPQLNNSRLIGTVEVAYGTPSRYEVTIYRVSITAYGEDHGWTVRTLVDEALRLGGLTLDDCPRSQLPPPPPPVRL
jgi:uncharacterized protein YjeT (DUF2065 family)